MGKKKSDPQSSTSHGPSDGIISTSHKRAGMQVDTLEPRILLSGTWVEVAAVAEMEPAEATLEEAPAWSAENNVVYGTEGNDWLKGADSDDVLAGLQGDDVLYGGDGNDRFVYRDGDGVDQNIGGAGEDQIDATGATSLILDEIHEKYSIECIVGGEKGLDIEGTESNNYLDFSTITLKNVSQIDGGAGDDVIIGSAGDDVILAGEGNDVLDGGKGDNDLLVMSGDVWDYKVNEQPDGTISISDMRGREGEDRATGFESYQFGDRTFNREELLKVTSSPDVLKELESRDNAVFIEQLRSEFSKSSLIEGTGDTDYLKGSGRDNVFVGLRGDDVLYGGDGNDRFIYRQGDGVDVAIGGDGEDFIDATRATSLQLNEIHQKYSVEYIVGSENGLTIEGTRDSNYLDFSTITLKNVSQIDGGAGDDVIIGSAGDDVILAGEGNDVLDGGKGDNDLLVMSGDVWDYKVNEQPDGTISISDMRGREGDDRAVGFESFQFGNRTFNRDELLKVASNPEIIREYQLRDNALFIEQLRSESAGGSVVEGTEASDQLKGTIGDDVFLGREGDDDLYGGDGNDRFVYRDGDGVDRNLGGSGVDMIDATQAQTLQLGEIHEKYSIEFIVGGEKGLTIEGTKENNYLDFTQMELKNVSAIDGGYGDDVIIGSRGDDVIFAGAGNDFLSGGEGENDVLVLSGNRSDYKIGELSTESLVIADRRGIDGEDQVTGFEQYRFADKTVSRDELFNQAPTGIKLDGGSVSEGAESGAVVGKLYAVDADRGDAHTFQIVDEKGNAVDDSMFAIKDNVLVVRDGQALDYETSATQTLHVKVTDSVGSSYIQNVSVRVEDANDAPTAIILNGGSVSESAESGTVVGRLHTVDADGNDSQTYELVDANGNAVKDSNFAIKENAIVVREGNSLDYETNSTQTVFVKTTDQSGAWHVEAIQINIADANDSPTAILLEGGSVSESSEAGTVVGKLSTVDVDRNDSHTYELVDEKGNSIDDATFVIKDNAIVVREGSSLDYESNSTQTVFVKTTDQSGAWHVEAIQINIADANDSPTAILLEGGSVIEAATAGTIVGKLSTNDADLNDQHIYEIVDGNGDAVSDSNFEIKGDTIIVRDGNALDYESSSTQTVFVKTTDAAGGSHVEAIQINITDANDAPTAVILSGNSISESATAGTVVGKLSTADADQGDSHTYQIVDANGSAVDNANFEIKEDAIVVRDGSALDFESISTQTVFVKTTDAAGASHVEAIQIIIADGNDAPTAITLAGGSVGESATAGTVVAKLSTADADQGDSHTYQIVDANGDAAIDVNFSIKGDTIVVREGSRLDYESSSTQTVYVKTTDQSGASHMEAIQITIADANDAPTAIILSDSSVSESAVAGTVVGRLSTSDADQGDSHTYQLVDDKGNLVDDANFVISGDAILVRDENSLDYETSVAQTVFVKSTDKGGSFHIEAIRIAINDANDAPAAIKLDGLSVSESASAGTVVGNLSTVDADQGDSHTYQLVDANGDAVSDSNFAIKGHAIVVRDGSALDYEASSSQTLFVKTTDKTGASLVEEFRITIDNANDTPNAITLDGGTVSESASAGTIVGKLSTGDADLNDSHTYQIVDGNGDAVSDSNFAIKGDTIFVRDGNALDYESSSTQTVFVKTTDQSGASHVEAIQINIADANDAPTAITLAGGSVSESAAAGTVVGKLSAADADQSDSHAYQIVDANGNAVDDANFEIKGNAIVVRHGGRLDYESISTETVFVKTTDAAGASHIEAIQINIADANDAPTAITLAGGSVSESATAGTVVGKLSTADADHGDSHTYQIVDSNGNVVSDSTFVINGDTIVVREGSRLDYESSSTQTVFVKTTDHAGASQIEQFTIQIEDANEAPIAVSGMVATVEDVSVVVRLNGVETDARDSIVLVRIDQMPPNGQLLLNGIPVEPGREILYSDVNSGGLIFVADKDWHGDTGLSFSVSDGESWSDTSAGFTIHVEAVADGASLIMEPARGLIGETIPLQLSAQALDLDGSEHLTIRIAGLPEGAMLSAGIRQPDGTWLLGSSDLSSLLLTLPQGQTQQFSLAITATTTEDNGSTSTASGSLQVTVDAPVSIVPAGSPTTGQPVQFLLNTISDDSQRHIEHTASLTGFTAEVPAQESSSLTERPLDDTRPVGDMFVTIRPITIDWTEAKFGDVQEITSGERAESQPDRSPLLTRLNPDDQSPTKTATTSTNAESASGFVWMWSAVRALTGMRDERRSQ